MGPETNPRSMGPDKNPRSIGPDPSMDPDPEYRPGNGPELTMAFRGMGWRGTEAKEGELSKEAARSIWAGYGSSKRVVDKGVEVLALIDAPEIVLKNGAAWVVVVAEEGLEEGIGPNWSGRM